MVIECKRHVWSVPRLQRVGVRDEQAGSVDSHVFGFVAEAGGFQALMVIRTCPPHQSIVSVHSRPLWTFSA